MGADVPEILRAAIDQAAESIVIADLTGRIRYANAAAERLVGRPSSRILGRHFVVALAEGDDPSRYEEIARAVSSGRVWSGSHYGTLPDGSRITVDLMVSPVRDRAGSVVNILATGRQAVRRRTLDSEAAREASRRAEIVAELARLDGIEDIPTRARHIADALLDLDAVSLARVVAFGPGGSADVVAASGEGTFPAVGRWHSTGLVRNMKRRAGGGAWIEPTPARASAGQVARELQAIGMTALGFAPIHQGGRAVGLLLVGSSATWGTERLEDQLTALVELGTVATGLLGPAFAAREQAEDIRAALLRIVEDHAFWPVFQPIVTIADGGIQGYEALTRFADGTAPDARFAQAIAVGLGMEFEVATLGAALRAAQALPTREAYLSVNVSPALVLEGARLGAVLSAAGDRQVVLEITEREPVDDYGLLRAAISQIGLSLRWAVDDAGAGYANLRNILELRPQYVKLDRTLVAGIALDPARQALVAGLLHFSEALGTTLIAEGIETEAERLALQGLGVSAGQGYLFGPPFALSVRSG